jgi:mannose-6-phosphate isomerase-like protein (cupin superfamily)
MLRGILNGQTHSGFPIELHETALNVGQAPHPPHHHVNEELLLIIEGTLDVTVAGITSRLGGGSVAYLASNVEHGWRNTGTIPARYFVLALGLAPPDHAILGAADLSLVSGFRSPPQNTDAGRPLYEKQCAS